MAFPVILVLGRGRMGGTDWEESRGSDETEISMEHTTEVEQLRLDAEQGDADAQFLLGIHNNGEGVPRDRNLG